MPPRERARPLEREPRPLGRHALEPRRRLTLAVGRDGSETLVEDLRGGVRAQLEAPRARRVPRAPRGELADVRAVELQGRAVASRLAVVGGAREDSEAAAELAADVQLAVGVARRG